MKSTSSVASRSKSGNGRGGIESCWDVKKSRGRGAKRGRGERPLFGVGIAADPFRLRTNLGSPPRFQSTVLRFSRCQHRFQASTLEHHSQWPCVGSGPRESPEICWPLIVLLATGIGPGLRLGNRSPGRQESHVRGVAGGGRLDARNRRGFAGSR